MESRSLSEITSETDEAASFQIENCVVFSVFIEKSSSILGELKDNKLMDTAPIRKSMESFETELQRAKALMGRVNNNSRQPSKKQIEETTHDLGRSLGLVLFASHDVPIDGKENIEALRRELMSARFDSCSESEFANDAETEKTEDTEQTEQTGETEIEEEIVDDEVTLDIDDVVLQVKYGNDDEFRSSLSVLNVLIQDNTVPRDWVSEEGVIPILFNRLGSSKPNNRITIIKILRCLASQNDENKEKMADPVGLTTLVKSLARNLEEQREALGLLLSLSDVSAARRRIGRIQGCIIVLVAILNGDDPVASGDAGTLLNALSSNTQNALHMAEAGYFKPLVQYLKEGSDMSKILMATALSRMELTDQFKASLGSDGAIKPLVKMFQGGKLEAKLSSLSALQNLSSLKENIQRLITTGIVSSLLQLLFSVTSVLMTLREPASAILAKIAESESILVKQDIAQQMLSLLNLSSPVIQHHLLQALNSIATHESASKVRTKMKENGAIQLLLPFLTENKTKIRTGALDLIYTLSKDLSEELAEILGETHVNILINILSSGVSEREKASAVGILCNLPVNDKKATDILKKANLLPILIPILSSSLKNSMPSTCSLVESIVGILIRFAVASDKKLQRNSVEQGVIPLLVKLLSNGSTVAKTRAAVALSQLSQNTMSLQKSKTSRWLCVSHSTDAFCKIHDGHCTVKGTFCLVKAGAISPMIQILESNERGSDEAVLGALATLLQDEIWENGSNYIVKMSGVQTILKVLEQGTVKAQEKALWILERIFRVEAHREEYGESAQVVLIDMAQTGDPKLKSMTGKVLVQLELLQPQSSYF
ncbi:U-box domain-containing protein 44-like [Actinidia eriantha]|uniref:U-box domain-containing protein 44-like n=1 Tax=Actinidia eriantha TaxID=165200 RepID=UPI002589B898|nr:U-box domain-containing protein 44-like [Actinidia eriantha]